MTNSLPFRIDTKVILGLAIILFGLAALMDNFGILDFSLWSYWPVLLILAGVAQLLQPWSNRQFVTGFLLTVAGGALLARNLGYIDFRLWSLWPLILIVIGVRIVGSGFLRGGQSGVTEAERIDLCAILGGGDFRFVSQRLRGGSLTAVMGGCTVDLREADTAEDTLVIDTFAFWGGIEIIVPPHWRVSMQGLPLLGGMENTAPAPDTLSQPAIRPARNLVVKGVAIMGGVEVKTKART